MYIAARCMDLFLNKNVYLSPFISFEKKSSFTLLHCKRNNFHSQGYIAQKMHPQELKLSGKCTHTNLKVGLWPYLFLFIGAIISKPWAGRKEGKQYQQHVTTNNGGTKR